MSELSILATKYAEACEWLEACPFTDGQPFYETAQPVLEELGERIVELATGHELAGQIVEALTDGNWGRFDDEVPFWRWVAEQTK